MKGTYFTRANWHMLSSLVQTLLKIVAHIVTTVCLPDGAGDGGRGVHKPMTVQILGELGILCRPRTFPDAFRYSTMSLHAGAVLCWTNLFGLFDTITWSVPWTLDHVLELVLRPSEWNRPGESYLSILRDEGSGFGMSQLWCRRQTVADISLLNPADLHCLHSP